jgi:hypothetical protein
VQGAPQAETCPQASPLKAGQAGLGGDLWAYNPSIVLEPGLPPSGHIL